MSWYSQEAYDIRFEWGIEGAKNLSAQVDVAIVVDVLSFSSCVDMAVSRGAILYPFLFKDDRARELANNIGAKLASPTRSKNELCLSPATMNLLNANDKVVLPSPNGSSISFEIQCKTVICGSLRNAEAVARHALSVGSKILVIAAGEKWKSGESLRPSLEDQIGAGAIISYLTGSKSPEAQGTEAIFKHSASQLHQVLSDCSSGRELIEKGFPEDVRLAAELNISNSVPVLQEKAYRRVEKICLN